MRPRSAFMKLDRVTEAPTVMPASSTCSTASEVVNYSRAVRLVGDSKAAADLATDHSHLLQAGLACQLTMPTDF